MFREATIQLLATRNPAPLAFENEISFDLARQTEAEQKDAGGQIVADDQPRFQDLQRGPFVSKGLNHVDQVSNVPAETVESDDQNGVASLDEVHEQSELRSTLQAFA